MNDFDKRNDDNINSLNSFGFGFENIVNSIGTGKKTASNNVAKTKQMLDFDIDNIEQNIFTNHQSNDDKNNTNTKTKKAFQQVDIKSGHRQRARERFLLNPNGTSDYDILELLLFLIIPRADTKPMAKVLLDKFKTISNIYNAKQEEIDECGVNGKALKYIFELLKTINNKILEENIRSGIKLQDVDTMVKYCRSLYKTMKEEEFFILFLDNKLKLIATKRIGVNGVANVSISQREIIQYALDLKAKNIVITHNHPSNDCTPSKEDIFTTNTIKNSLKNIDVDVIEHIVVGSSSYFSFAENDLL